MKVLPQRYVMGSREAYSYLETVDVATGERQVLAEFPYLIEAPNWTADGKSLVYNSRGKLYRFDLASHESTAIDTGYCVYCNNDHVLAPDGTGVAVSHQAAEDGQSRVYVIPYDGSGPRLITPVAPSYLHGWSPDGKTLAYCGERNGQFDIYTIPVGGGVETQLTDEPGLDDGPEYSPCGKYIWFNSTRSGLMQAWRMEADGRNPTQMTNDPEGNCWFPHVSPDGKLAAYIAYRRGDVAPNDHPADKDVELRVMNADGTGTRTLVKLFGGQGTLNVNSWAPDSKTFAFVSYKRR